MARQMYLAVGLTLASLTFGALAEAGDTAPTGTAASNSVEEIYVLRSVREKRQRPPTEACAKDRSQLSDPAWEDFYTFRAVTTRETDGRVAEAAAKDVGNIRACFGNSSESGVLDFYGEAMINGVPAKASGKCRATKTNFPEAGVNLFACVFELYDLPAPYIGGQLTTNSLSSAQLFGVQSEPGGYTQVSIATIRLWRKRG